jgi:alpha-glucosidase (family GH31 glycosyl hydrolase)
MQKLFIVAILFSFILCALWIASPRLTDAAPTWQSFEPPTWILGPLEGADGTEADVMHSLDMVEKWNLPITAYHFDSPTWQSCIGSLQFGYSDAVLNRMRADNIRALFWLVPLIGKDCPQYSRALKKGYFVKNSRGKVIVTNNFTGHGSWIDFKNPGAVAYWNGLLDNLVARVGKKNIGGFYTDAVRPDLPTGSTDAVAYSEAYGLDLLNYTRAHIPDGDVIFKQYQGTTPSHGFLTQYAHAAYMGDLPTTFGGMQEGIRRVFATNQFMPLAYNEFSGYNAKPPDTETLIRRFHWGAFQPVMEDVPKTDEPWDPGYPPLVMQTYQYYANLHAELAPYLHSYDEAAYESHTPIFRDMNSTNFSARLGNEIFVQYVTAYQKDLQVTFPISGTWIDYWNPTQVYSPSTTITYHTPLGKEPIFIAQGAIIPMNVRNRFTGHGTGSNQGSLTLETFPTDHSTFHYSDPINHWLDFDVTKTDVRLALCTLNALPSQPLIWRINQMTSAPALVQLKGGAVGVNTAWADGATSLVSRKSESAVGNSSSGWYYDANADRLIVKISTLGNNCPAP